MKRVLVALLECRWPEEVEEEEEEEVEEAKLRPYHEEALKGHGSYAMGAHDDARVGSSSSTSLFDVADSLTGPAKAAADAAVKQERAREELVAGDGRCGGALGAVGAGRPFLAGHESSSSTSLTALLASLRREEDGEKVQGTPGWK